jgi:uncharacterized protein
MLMPLIIDDLISKNQNKTTSHIQLAIEDSFKRLLNQLFQMKLYRKPNQSGCKFHPGFATNLGQLLLAPIRRKKDFGY